MATPTHGKLLRMDLGTGRRSVEEIPRRYYDLFVGGRGLGAALLYDEVKPDADPLDPDQNRLIFTVGPLTGLGASGTAKCVVLCKSPQTGIYLYSVTSKSFGVRLKKAGYDALILQGRARVPSVLIIRNDQVSVRERPDLWGRLTDDAEEILLRELGAREYSVAIIGPAGENRVRYASILNDSGRAFGRGGAGAVMGAMHLKAIAVAGDGRVTAADPAAWKAALAGEVTHLKGSALIETYHKFGSPITADHMHTFGIMPVRNYQRNVCTYLDEVGSMAIRQHHLKTTNCPPCVVGCTQWTHGTAPDGTAVSAEGPEYETIYAFGSACDVRQFSGVIQADHLCDQLGLDTISAGLTIAFAMECWERGLITEADTGGLTFTFGDGANYPAVLQAIAGRQGFGDALAEGSARLAGRIGQGADHFAMHVKGMELGGYDPRAAKGMSLVYAVGPRGGCHHAGGRTVTVECGPNGRPLAEQGKAELLRRSRAERIAFDVGVMCTFNVQPVDILANLLSAATGESFTADSLFELGERVSNLERLFNARAGVRRTHDTLPGRLLHDPVGDGPARGQTVNLSPMLDELYAACGWDPVFALPLPETLAKQGLERYAGDAGTLIGRA